MVRQEIDGFVVNRLQGALLEEAFRLVGDGICGAEDVDAALRDGLALRWSFMGPFETIDLNAPEGVRDYIERYQPLYTRLFHSMQRRVDWDGPVADRNRGRTARPAAKSPTSPSASAGAIAASWRCGATSRTPDASSAIDKEGLERSYGKTVTKGHHHLRRDGGHSYAQHVAAPAGHAPRKSPMPRSARPKPVRPSSICMPAIPKPASPTRVRKPSPPSCRASSSRATASSI
jgi:hypothetical protein